MCKLQAKVALALAWLTIGIDAKVFKHKQLARRRSGDALVLKGPTIGPPPWDKSGSKSPEKDIPSPEEVRKGDVEVRPTHDKEMLGLPAAPEDAAEALEKPERAHEILHATWVKSTSVYVATTIVGILATFIGIILCACVYSHFKVDPSRPPNDGFDHHPALLDRGTFRYGFFNCFHDSHICLIGCCCPILRWSDTMRMAGLMTFWHGVMLIGILSALSFVTGNLTGFIALCVMVYMRQQLRRIFGIRRDDVSCLEDCCSYLCCTCCAIIQEARQLEETYAVAHPIAVRVIAETAPLVGRKDAARAPDRPPVYEPSKPPPFENFPPPQPPSPDVRTPMSQQSALTMPQQSGPMQAQYVPSGSLPPPRPYAPQGNMQYSSGSLPPPGQYPSGSLPPPGPPGSLPPPGQYAPPAARPPAMQSLPMQYGAPVQYTSMPPGQYAGPPPGQYAGLPPGQYPPPGSVTMSPPGSMTMPPQQQ